VLCTITYDSGPKWGTGGADSADVFAAVKVAALPPSNMKLETDDRNQIQKKGGKFVSFSSEDEKEFRRNLAKTRDNVLKECPETGKVLLEILDKYTK
jgi:TRAP-type C4-dicarboxylate transport system substrate-binding protein